MTGPAWNRITVTDQGPQAARSGSLGIITVSPWDLESRDCAVAMWLSTGLPVSYARAGNSLLFQQG